MDLELDLRYSLTERQASANAERKGSQMSQLTNFSIRQDLIDALNKNNEKLMEPVINETPLLMRTANMIFSELSGEVAKAELQYSQAKIESERQYALALLERASIYAEQKQLKLTDTLRKAYADTDELYIKAKEHQEQAKAVLTFLQGKLEASRHDYYAAKRIFEKASHLTTIQDA
jgi:hypothetical protein